MASPNERPPPFYEGAMVISVWYESQVEDGFRARLSAIDATGNRRDVGAVADEGSALDLIKRWLMSLRPPASVR